MTIKNYVNIKIRYINATSEVDFTVVVFTKKLHCFDS